MFQRFLRGALAAAVSIPLALAMLPLRASAQDAEWSPTPSWNTYLGGGGRLADGGVDPAPFLDEVRGLAVGPGLRADAYVSGRTGSRIFPADGGVAAGYGGNDAFVARLSGEAFSEEQVVRWARVFGGSGEDVATRVLVTPDGVMYVAGTTQSQSMFSAPSVAATVVPGYTHQGGQDAFLARVEPDGRLRWFMYLGSTGSDQGYDLALGPEGSNAVYVVGATAGPSLNTAFPPNTPESNVRYRTGVSEGFVTKVDVSNPDSPSVRWTRIIGSNEIDAAYSVAVVGDAVYVGGIMGSLVEGGLSSLTEWGDGTDDGFVARLRDTGATGEFAWFTYVGATGKDEVRSILLRANGGLAIVGNTNSRGFPFAGRGTDDDVFVLRMNARGIVEGTGLVLGGSGEERTEGQAAIDVPGNIYVAGRTYSATGSGLARNAFDAELASGPGNASDGFIAMVNADVSQKLSASYVGGLGTGDESEWVYAVASGPLGQVTFGGSSNARDWFKVPYGAHLTPASGLDGFLIRAEMDLTAPDPGVVTASITQGTGLQASWRDFTDVQTGIAGYEWAIGTSLFGTDVQPFQPQSASVTSVTLSDFQAQPQLRYYFSVKARNGVGRETTISSEIVISTSGGSDAGTGDGGTDAGTGDAGTPDGGPGPGTDGGTGEESSDEDLPPLGWSCASGGGTGALALTGLLVLAVLMARRRERPERAHARVRPPRR